MVNYTYLKGYYGYILLVEGINVCQKTGFTTVSLAQKDAKKEIRLRNLKIY